MDDESRMVSQNSQRSLTDTVKSLTGKSRSLRSRYCSSCLTTVDNTNLVHYWKIENAGQLINLSLPGYRVRSTFFRSPTCQDASWQLCLFPAGKRTVNENNVSLFLKMISNSRFGELQIRTEYQFCFLNEKGECVFKNVNIGTFSARPSRGHSWGLRNIPKQKVINSLHKDGSLHIYCELSMLSYPFREMSLCKCPKTFAENVPCGKEFVNSQLAALKNGSFSDCIIECRGEDIPVSKMILSAHSQVFRAMFSHESLLESINNRVVIEGADVKTVRKMLEYMYCGRVDIEDEAEKLLRLADRYQLSELKLKCEEALAENVDINNCVAMFLLSDLYSCENLKSVVFETFCLFDKEVYTTDGWRMMKEQNPSLSAQLMEEIIAKSSLIIPPPPPRKRQKTGN